MSGWADRAAQRADRLARARQRATAAEARVDRLTGHLVETRAAARAAGKARDAAQARAAAAQTAAEHVGRQASDAQARLRRIADVLADQRLATVDCPACNRARQVLMEDAAGHPVPERPEGDSGGS
jgi:chromosome segregation ATPase